MGGGAAKSERNEGPSTLLNLPLTRLHFSPPFFRPSKATPASQARGMLRPYNGLFGEAPKTGCWLIFRTVSGHRAHPKGCLFSGWRYIEGKGFQEMKCR